MENCRLCEFDVTWGVMSEEKIKSVFENVLNCDYDLDRLRELVEADMDGRCMIAPVKPGEVAWCGFVQRNPASGETKNIVYPVVLKGWWTGLKCKESDPRLFLFGELHESEEAANEALKGEKDGKSN